MRVSLIIYLLSVGGISAFAQSDSTVIVKYTPDFDFNDGFYLNFEQLKSNSPIIPSRIVASLDVNDVNFYDEIVKAKKLIYFDNLGVRHEVGIEKIWGYAKYGNIYVNVRGVFNRINVVGSICHFIATIKTYQSSYNDPFMYGSYMGGIGYTPRMRSGGYETTEVRQLILDFETGKIFDYSLENLEAILSRDTELYLEFSLLKKKKKKQLKFVYLRKYNEKHPLFFPEN